MMLISRNACTSIDAAEQCQAEEQWQEVLVNPPNNAFSVKWALHSKSIVGACWLLFAHLLGMFKIPEHFFTLQGRVLMHGLHMHGLATQEVGARAPTHAAKAEFCAESNHHMIRALRT